MNVRQLARKLPRRVLMVGVATAALATAVPMTSAVAAHSGAARHVSQVREPELPYYRCELVRHEEERVEGRACHAHNGAVHEGRINHSFAITSFRGGLTLCRHGFARVPEFVVGFECRRIEE